MQSNEEISSLVGSVIRDGTERDLVKVTMKYSIKVHSPAGLRGMELLDTPIWNKGTAFNESERAAFGLRGLLPPHIEALEQQLIRAYEGFKAKATDLERHRLFLSELDRLRSA
jgi:hypothetical protein